MRLEILGRNLGVTDDVSGLVERGVVSALTPFRMRVGLVRVLLDEPVPGGPVRCHILVGLPPAGGVGVGEIAPDLAIAVDRGARRAAEEVGRALARRRARRDGRGVSGTYVLN